MLQELLSNRQRKERLSAHRDRTEPLLSSQVVCLCRCALGADRQEGRVGGGHSASKEWAG